LHDVLLAGDSLIVSTCMRSVKETGAAAQDADSSHSISEQLARLACARRSLGKIESGLLSTGCCFESAYDIFAQKRSRSLSF
jgi:hypothetical protein